MKALFLLYRILAPSPFVVAHPRGFLQSADQRLMRRCLFAEGESRLARQGWVEVVIKLGIYFPKQTIQAEFGFRLVVLTRPNRIVVFEHRCQMWVFAREMFLFIMNHIISRFWALSKIKVKFFFLLIFYFLLLLLLTCIFRWSDLHYENSSIPTVVSLRPDYDWLISRSAVPLLEVYLWFMSKGKVVDYRSCRRRLVGAFSFYWLGLLRLTSFLILPVFNCAIPFLQHFNQMTVGLHIIFTDFDIIVSVLFILFLKYPFVTLSPFN